LRGCLRRGDKHLRLGEACGDAALVNDRLRDYWSKAAIRSLVKRDIIGEKLTIAVTKVIKHYDNFIVTADIDGILTSAVFRTFGASPRCTRCRRISVAAAIDSCRARARD
jgi:hypothetical protein